MRKIIQLVIFLVGFNAQAMDLKLFTSQTPIWSQIAVGGGGESFVYTVYRVLLPDIQAGDRLDIMAEAQMRNDLGYNVELAQALSVRDCDSASFPASFDNDIWTGIVGPPNGYNITPGAHYGKVNKGFVYTVPTGRPCVSVELRLRARSSATSGGVVNLYTELSQGFIQVKRWR